MWRAFLENVHQIVMFPQSQQKIAIKISHYQKAVSFIL